MMLPIKELTVCEAKSLTPGDFAYLADIGNSPVLIGEAADKTALALFIGDDPRNSNISEVQSLYGCAIKVVSYEIEVDAEHMAQWDRSAETARGILATEMKLHFIATGPRGLFPVGINWMDQGFGEGISALFARWRVVKQLGSDRIVLFEKGDA